MYEPSWEDSKKKPNPKKARAKMMGEDVNNINSPLNKKKKQCGANQAASYYSTTTLKGYTINPHSKGSKFRIDVVFHKGGMPPKFAEPMMMLDLGGKALCVKWKASERLYFNEQATSQGIPMDSVRYTGYTDPMECMHQAGVTVINGNSTGEPLK
jgi:hypothetical protein